MCIFGGDQHLEARIEQRRMKTIRARLWLKRLRQLHFAQRFVLTALYLRHALKAWAILKATRPH